MSDFRPTDTLVDTAGSTVPAAKLEQLAHEAVKIREYWSTRAVTNIAAGNDLDSACFYRHKSLVLKLARDSYLRDSGNSSGDISPAEYSRRYAWLGDPLQHSIYKMLEVQEYANEHPELFGSPLSFEWPKEGDQFLNFHILEELGRGSTGRVYLCESRNLGDKQVVLKIEPGEHSTEAALLGKLRHPHITPVNWADFDPSLNATFLCMPFLARSTLADLVDLCPSDGPPKHGAVVETASRLWARASDTYAIPFSQKSDSYSSGSSYITRIVRLARDLADGLAFVHGENITHGDIKPSNVLLASDGQVYLLDFNLGRASHTPCSRYGGTAPYMAPERVKQVLRNDPNLPSINDGIAADIFSFGALLYELLTGKPPYEARSKHGSLETVCDEMAVLHEDGHRSALTVNPAVGARLSILIDRCLDLEPHLRPSRMQDIISELDTINAPTQRLGRTIRQNPASSLLVSGFLFGAIAFASYSLSVQAPKAEQLYQRASTVRRAGDLKAAIDFLDEALLIEPNKSSARLLRARSYNDAGDYSRAAVDLVYLERNFPSASITAYQAYTNQLKDDHASAALEYEHAIREGMKNSAILNNLALAYFLRPDSSSSDEMAALTWPVIEEALALNPNSPQIHMTAFTYYRRHPQRLDETIIAATEHHVDWLTENAPEQSSVTRAIHGYYSMLARHQLVKLEKVEKARQLMKKSTVTEPLDRLMDPLECER